MNNKKYAIRDNWLDRFVCIRKEELTLYTAEVEEALTFSSYWEAKEEIVSMNKLKQLMKGEIAIVTIQKVVDSIEIK